MSISRDALLKCYHSMPQDQRWEARSRSASKNFPSLYGTVWLIPVFTIGPPLVPTLSMHSQTLYFHNHFNIIVPYTPKILHMPSFLQVSFFTFRNTFIFYGEGLLAPRRTPRLEDHPLSFVRGCLFNIFAATFHSWRLFLHPQTVDAPCCGDRTVYQLKCWMHFPLHKYALTSLPWFYLPSNISISWRVTIMSVLITHYSQSFCNILPHRT
jgi:hypothetical protein